MMKRLAINSDLSKKPGEDLIKLSEFFVIVLVGVSFEATIEPIGKAIREGERVLGNLLLLLTFITVTFRFLVGNFRHLRSDAWKEQPRSLLLYDMWWIGLESVTMIFLGTLTSVENNLYAHRHYSVDYIWLQVALYVLDAIWISSHKPLGRCLPNWKRIEGRLPFLWLWINLVLIVVLILLELVSSDVLSNGTLGLVAGLSVVALVVDVLEVHFRQPSSEIISPDPSPDPGR